MSEDVKFCIDCKYILTVDKDGVNLPWDQVQCGHAKAVKNYPLYLVSGNNELLNRYACNIMRGEHCGCGYEGTLFEPIPVKAAA